MFYQCQRWVPKNRYGVGGWIELYPYFEYFVMPLSVCEQLLCVYVFRPRRSGVCASAASTGRGEGGCSTDGRAQASLAHHEDEGIPRRARADRHGNAAVWLAPRQPVRPTADQRTHSAVVETQSDQRPQSR